MKVTALISTYNHERYIGEAIESALMQETSFDFEIVISEDCSTDRTRAIAESYRARYPDRIRASYSSENRGEETWVRSYHSCRGGYVALLDGDDYWSSAEKLQKQADFLDGHSECSMCGHAMAVVHDDGSEPPIYWIHPEQKEISTLEDLILNNFIFTSSAMLRREAFDDHPAWVYDAPFKDYPFWIEVAQHGSVGYIKEFLGVYRRHSEGAWTGKPASAQVEDLIWFHNRMRQELGSGYDDAFERVLARFHGQLACERAGVPDDAVVLVVSGGDPELIKVRPNARHLPWQPSDTGELQPQRATQLVELIEAERVHGGQFLLFPRTASAWAHSSDLRQALDDRYMVISDTDDAVLYDLRGRTMDRISHQGVKRAPAVAVVVTSYNLGEYLDEAVTSVLEQTLEDVEIVVVDDGSTDPFTNELLDSYQRPRTRVLRQENQGLAAARNNGIEQTSAPYICCLDADDRIRPAYLARAVEVFEQRPEVGIVASNVEVFGAYEFGWRCGPCRLPEMLVVNRIQAAALFRREAWQRAGGYRATIPMAVQDWDLWLTILELGFKGEVIPEVLFDYRAREASMWHSSGGDPKLRGPMYRALWEAHASTYAAYLGAVGELVAVEEAHAQQRYAELEAEIAVRGHALQALNERAAGAEQALHDVMSSSSWRITRPLRALKRAIRSL